ncbi:MAG TPA: serine/threonine-protein kinase [Rhodanobacteraceae bacterium]|nr:serine/threonine-protein kinase [Rhodanobacteraceae bacterium]
MGALEPETYTRRLEAVADFVPDAGALPAAGALSGRLFSRLVEDGPEDALLSPGTRIGDWSIGPLIGRGGSASVYLADRADGHFEQQVALKIVRREESLTEPFRRERQILARLRHPAIVQLIDGGETACGRLWFAMEPVFGERIDAYVRNRRLPLDERLRLFEAVCDAIEYAHGRRLIHGDIKPDNLLVDETGRPRLLDFGIASSEAGLASRGHRAMTPGYASPEQHAGDVVTARSDVYQLGVLLRALVMTDGTATLDAIIARATSADARQRYPSVVALRSAVDCVRQTQAKEERPWALAAMLSKPFRAALESFVLCAMSIM